jgi:hypothetical protein
MRPVALSLLLVSIGQAATRNVTVLVDFEKPHSDVSMIALREELRQLLQPAGIAIDVMLKSEMPVSPQFAELVVFHMKGSCTINVAPVDLSNASDDRRWLGMTYTSDGQILHFGAVQCDRIRRCLQQVTVGRSLEQRQVEYGNALGLVVAHEICHMVIGAKTHTKDGLTKESLSARDLLDGELSIPSGVREALRKDLLATRQQ